MDLTRESPIPLAAQRPADVAAEAKPGLRQWWWLILAGLTYAMNNLDRNILNVVQEQVKNEFGLSDSQLGALSGLAFGAVYALSAIGMGLLADRVNRRNMLASVLVIWSVMTAVCAFVQSFGALLLARMSVAAAEAGTSPTSTSMISDWFPPQRRATAMSIYYLGPPLGLIISTLLGGLIAQHYGWRMAFLVAGAPGLVLAALLLLTCPHPKRGSAEVAQKDDTPAPGLLDAVAHIWRNAPLRWSVAAVTLATMASASFSSFVVSFLMRTHHLPISQAGGAVSLCVGVASAVGILAGGPLADRLARGPRSNLRVAAATVSLSAIGIAICVLSGATLPALAGLTLFGCFHMSYIAPCFSTVLNGSPPRLRGISIAILMLVANMVGGASGPIVVGFISDQIGGPDSLRFALLTVAPEFLATAGLLLLAAQSLPARLRPVGEPILT